MRNEKSERDLRGRRKLEAADQLVPAVLRSARRVGCGGMLLERRTSICGPKCSTFNAVSQSGPLTAASPARLSVTRHIRCANLALVARVRVDMHIIADLAREMLVIVKVTSFRALFMLSSARKVEGVHRRQRGRGRLSAISALLDVSPPSTIFLSRFVIMNRWVPSTFHLAPVTGPGSNMGSVCDRTYDSIICRRRRGTGRVKSH
ncbi:hypothetical protein FIBSPDRAFT_239285 [Athelia psychrophila]|uniref:Uncharacterized protein n=1 Tax=Athelia psychrophila TaxID=1759441 RepID=A0A165YER6_9AGAM|nr:hypothetical protein FIBSPDRAFT_239285 [Fibularhizoctonia sp. CBS 109695]